MSIPDPPITCLAKPALGINIDIEYKIAQAMLWTKEVMVDAIGVDPATVGADTKVIVDREALALGGFPGAPLALPTAGTMALVSIDI